jgi:hypothetical protein
MGIDLSLLLTFFCSIKFYLNENQNPVQKKRSVTEKLYE